MDREYCWVQEFCTCVREEKQQKGWGWAKTWWMQVGQTTTRPSSGWVEGQKRGLWQIKGLWQKRGWDNTTLNMNCNITFNTWIATTSLWKSELRCISFGTITTFGRGKGEKKQRQALFLQYPSLNLLTNVAMSIYSLPFKTSSFCMPNLAYLFLIVKSLKKLQATVLDSAPVWIMQVQRGSGNKS